MDGLCLVCLLSHGGMSGGRWGGSALSVLQENRDGENKTDVKKDLQFCVIC